MAIYRRHRIAVVALAAFMALQLASRVFDLGSLIAEGSYWAVMASAAAVVVVSALRREEHRAAWGLIGVGLAAWAAGDLYYFIVLAGGEIPYPSPSDALYLVMYMSLVAGMRMLRGRAAISLALVVVLLGLATLWSLLVFNDVVAGATGGRAAIATTVAYPLLDLVLVATTLLTLTARGGRSDRVFLMLAAGFLLMAAGDSVYAAQVAHGTYKDGTLLESLWPAGALCIAAAAWMDTGRNHLRKSGSDTVVEILTGAAIAVGIGVLFADHFVKVDTVTLVLSGATLLTAVSQRVVIHRERARAEASVDAAEELRTASAEAALDCIVSIDGAGLVVEWNDAAARTFGYPREDALGVELAELIIPPEHREQHRTGLARVSQTGEHRILNSQMEVMAMHADGTDFPVELMITQVRVDPPLFTGFLRDITERRLQAERNELLAAIVRSSENALISKDLNGVVTAWNGGAERLYGYTEEAAVGRQIAELIIPAANADEMKLVTKSVLEGEAVSLETERRRQSGQLVEVSLRAFAIRDISGAIVGVCTSAHDITERRRREVSERRDKEGRLWRDRIHTALTEGRFMYWGQPVIDAATGGIDHHELLLRMDLDGDVITPNHFLPHAEGSELMTEIDRWAIKTGFEIAATLPVAINLSARSLEDVSLIGDIKKALGSRALAGNVTFEITESAAIENLDAARELVEELTSLGFGVALDDFGTGYGSFTYLQQLPVTELKIDIDYVRALARDRTDQRLVKSIVSVARNFEMKTVAEGVEDQATSDLLRELDVDFLQGYYLGYPVQMTVSSRWPAELALVDYPDL